MSIFFSSAFLEILDSKDIINSIVAAVLMIILTWMFSSVIPFFRRQLANTDDNTTAIKTMKAFFAKHPAILVSFGVILNIYAILYWGYMLRELSSLEKLNGITVLALLIVAYFFWFSLKSLGYNLYDIVTTYRKKRDSERVNAKNFARIVATNEQMETISKESEAISKESIEFARNLMEENKRLQNIINQYEKE